MPCFGHLQFRRAADRWYTQCARCGYESPGVTLDLPPPRPCYMGLLSFRDLCAARKRGIEPVVKPEWATRREARRKTGT